MGNLAKQLRQTKLLKDISEDVIEKHILPLGSRAVYQKDQHVFSEQDRINSIMILLSGKVNMLYLYADGRYGLTASETPTRILALDLIATKSGISPYYAVAAKDSVIFSFPASAILQPGALPETDRQTLISQLLIMLSHMHMQKEQHLMILSQNSIREKILCYFSLQSSWKRSNSFTVPFSREEMAAYLQINRSVLSHELSLMKQEDIIEFSKNHFTLLKPFHNH